MLPAVLLLLLVVDRSLAWRYTEYDKPEGWPGQCTDGKHQSPIDLVVDPEQETFVVEPLEFFNYHTLNGSLTNNGHSIAIHFAEDHCDSGITGGNLRAQYVLEEMHFHWESEHTVSGARFPLELHLVHYNRKYIDMKHALHQHDGLAVLAVLFYESGNSSEIIDQLLEAVKPVASSKPGKQHMSFQFNPIDFVPTDRHSFYRYQGSLTTPPCSEIVTWTVLEKKMPISTDQIKLFREVQTDDGILEHNYRRLQPLNEREVYLLSDNDARTVRPTLAVILVAFCLISNN